MGVRPEREASMSCEWEVKGLVNVVCGEIAIEAGTWGRVTYSIDTFLIRPGDAALESLCQHLDDFWVRFCR